MTGPKSKHGWMREGRHFDMARVRLAETAGIHSQYYGHYRVGVPHFPFSIYYDIEGDSIIVKAILDDRFGPLRISAHFGPK